MARPRSNAISLLYIRTDTTVSASLNGAELPATALAGTEYLFEVPGNLWKKTNTISLRISRGTGDRADGIMPVVYLTCPDGVERLRHGIIRITSADLDRGTIDLSGPVFIKQLSEKEYRDIKEEPDDHEIDHAQCAVIPAPSTADHVPGVIGSRRLVTECSFIWKTCRHGPSVCTSIR